VRDKWGWGEKRGRGARKKKGQSVVKRKIPGKQGKCVSHGCHQAAEKRGGSRWGGEGRNGQTDRLWGRKKNHPRTTNKKGEKVATKIQEEVDRPTVPSRGENNEEAKNLEPKKL